jgi:formate hydrogenlyase subunit 6/NADH:ubiquinone oxidoreductase subunit I
MAKTKPKKSRISPMFKRTISHLFTKPYTTKYPFVKPKLPEGYRGKPEYTIKACNMIELCGNKGELCFDVKSLVNTNCTVCCRDCPANAIEIVEVDGKKRPQFDLNKCIFCNQCVDSCRLVVAIVPVVLPGAKYRRKTLRDREGRFKIPYLAE